MELLFDIVAELALKLLEKVARHSENERTQNIVVVLVASVCILVVEGLAVWGAVSCYQQGNVLLTVAFASVVVISLLIIGAVVLRRIIRRRKAETEA
mgnify:CR=1 FL=1